MNRPTLFKSRLLQQMFEMYAAICGLFHRYCFDAKTVALISGWLLWFGLYDDATYFILLAIFVLLYEKNEKMEHKTNVNVTGISFAGLLAICFIVLKLTGYIAWAWVWVLSPLWIPAVIAVLILIGVIIWAALKS